MSGFENAHTACQEKHTELFSFLKTYLKKSTGKGIDKYDTTKKLVNFANRIADEYNKPSKDKTKKVVNSANRIADEYNNPSKEANITITFRGCNVEISKEMKDILDKPPFLVEKNKRSELKPKTSYNRQIGRFPAKCVNEIFFKMIFKSADVKKYYKIVIDLLFQNKGEIFFQLFRYIYIGDTKDKSINLEKFKNYFMNIIELHSCDTSINLPKKRNRNESSIESRNDNSQDKTEEIRKAPLTNEAKINNEEYKEIEPQPIESTEENYQDKAEEISKASLTNDEIENEPIGSKEENSQDRAEEISKASLINKDKSNNKEVEYMNNAISTTAGTSTTQNYKENIHSSEIFELTDLEEANGTWENADNSSFENIIELETGLEIDSSYRIGNSLEYESNSVSDKTEPIEELIT